jgi:hypothetical protein
MAKKRVAGVGALAKSYRVSESTIRRWITTGALPATRNARGQWTATRIPVRDVRASLAEQKAGRDEQRRAERAAAARVYGSTIEQRRERDLGIVRVTPGADLAALVVTVYRSAGSRKAFDAPRALRNVMRHVTRAVPGDVDYDAKRPWLARVTFLRSLTEAELAVALARLSVPRRALLGGRMHLAALTTNREFLPMSKAYENPRQARIEALDQLSQNLERYRGRVDMAA